MSSDDRFRGISDSIKYLYDFTHKGHMGSRSEEDFDPSQLSEYVLYKMMPLAASVKDSPFMNNRGEIVNDITVYNYRIVKAVHKVINGVYYSIILYCEQRDYERYMTENGLYPYDKKTLGIVSRGGRRSNKKRTKRNHKNKKHRKSNKRR